MVFIQAFIKKIYFKMFLFLVAENFLGLALLGTPAARGYRYYYMAPAVYYAPTAGYGASSAAYSAPAPGYYAPSSSYSTSGSYSSANQDSSLSYSAPSTGYSGRYYDTYNQEQPQYEEARKKRSIGYDAPLSSFSTIRYYDNYANSAQDDSLVYNNARKKRSSFKIINNLL